ncbi:MAG TPA: CoA pyrophosphatase [Acidobacteriota bacterium]|nr:CoA pyrophosphatase [Acidobacteriota bacterium]
MPVKDHIRNCLQTLRPRIITNGFHQQAAVLMPIYEHQGEPYFLLTRRTNEVHTHKGQVSFPGGMREKNEDLAATAVRETFEEVGIEEDRIELLGRFHDYISITEYRVTPFAAFLRSPFNVKPHAAEVAKILHVPFKTFCDPERMWIGKTVYGDKDVNVYHYLFGNEEIWGLTARIIKDFLETIRINQ